MSCGVSCLPPGGSGGRGRSRLARSLAIAGLTGRPIEAKGVRVERRGEEVLVIGPESNMTSNRAVGQNGEPGRVPSRRRGQALVSS